MKSKGLISIILPLILVLLFGCSQEKSKLQDKVILGIASDVTNFNPLYAFNGTEVNVSEIIFPGLLGHNWDDTKGEITSFPLLAEDWEWSKDSSSITFNLRQDVYWSDSVQFTADDVVYSFDLYSDVVVNSRFYASFDNYYLNSDLSIDLDKSFEIISSHKVKFNFRPGSVPSLFDTDMPILPKHVFENIAREDIATSEVNFKPVGSGPYQLADWNKNQSIVLRLNHDSFLAKENSIEELIFKIIPDYNSRLVQLKNQEIDFMEEVRPEDLNDLKDVDYLSYTLRKGREYEYVGWNNLDPVEFAEEGKLVPHKLFGDSNERKALTHAINRQMILDEFLSGYGQISTGPVAPIFDRAINKNVKPRGYNPTLAKEILKNAGWTDTDSDGILDKDGKDFSFDLSIPGGNPLRVSVATVIQNNLKAIGINVNIVTLEPSVLIDQMFGKKLDAWISGWAVPIPILLKPFWHSDLESNIPNVASYRNKEIDSILDKLETCKSVDLQKDLFKRFQEIIQNDEPVTFLFWMDNIVVYNSKIENMDINPLGSIHYCWNWTLKE